MTSRAPGKRADAAHALAALAVCGRLDPAAFAVALSRFAPRPDRQILRSVVPALQLALTTASMNADGTAPPVHTTAAAHHALAAAAAVRRVALPRTRANAAALQALTLLADRPSRSSVPDAARRVLAALTR